MCKRLGAFNRKRHARWATPMTSKVDRRLETQRVSLGIRLASSLKHGQSKAPQSRRIAVKTILASLGGALAMLLVVATWQARTSASQFASAPASWAPAPATYAAAPSNLATLPQGVVMAAPSPGVVPIAYTPVRVSARVHPLRVSARRVESRPARDAAGGSRSLRPVVAAPGGLPRDEAPPGLGEDRTCHRRIGRRRRRDRRARGRQEGRARRRRSRWRRGELVRGVQAVGGICRVPGFKVPGFKVRHGSRPVPRVWNAGTSEPRNLGTSEPRNQSPLNPRASKSPGLSMRAP